MNFILSCSTRYLTRSLRSLVRYRVEHSKITFISTRGHVISSISPLGPGTFCYILRQARCYSMKFKLFLSSISSFFIFSLERRNDEHGRDAILLTWCRQIRWSKMNSRLTTIELLPGLKFERCAGANAFHCLAYIKILP